MNKEVNIREISTLKTEFGPWECLIEDGGGGRLSLGGGKIRIIKTCFSPKSIEKILKAEERSSIL